MTPKMPGGSSGCSTSTLTPGGGPSTVAAAKTGEGDDEESQWGSDWDSDLLYESDWESDDGKQREDYDSENEVLRVKSIRRLISDDSPGQRTPTTKARRRVARPADEDHDDHDDDDDDDDDTGSDSDEGVLAVACHFCKLRNAERKVHCSRCPIQFCGSCLRNRNGEQLEVEAQEGVNWVCPKCRPGCGPGCNNCCTCAPCRKSRGLAPAGQVIRIARQAGFDNVHDYLIHRQTGESRNKIAKRKKGRGWTKAGGAMSSSGTGEVVPKLKPAQLSTTADCVPADRGGDGLWNQDKGLAWTVPKAVDDMTNSNSKNVKPGNGKPEIGHIKPPPNGMKALKFVNDERKGPPNEHKVFLDHVLGRVAQKPERKTPSLEEIVNRLLYPDDESGKSLHGSVQQKIRNRKHRRLGRILEPSMFRKRKSNASNATKRSEATPQLLPTVRKHKADIDQRSQEATPVQQRSDPPPTLQSVPGSQRHQPSSEASIQLKRPITSLQALRKMGILAKRDHASVASDESSQQHGPAIAPSPPPDQSNQSLKQSSKLAATSPPVGPSTSSEPASQTTLVRQLDKRKKIEFRSCSKPQQAIPPVPASGKLAKESRTVWRGGTQPRQSGQQTGFGQLSERGSVTGSELPRQNGTPSGFESFSKKEPLLGSFKGKGQAGLAALRT